MSDRRACGRAPRARSSAAMSNEFKDRLCYCLVEGVPVFLDVAQDRYFRLGPAAERAFLEPTIDPMLANEARVPRLPDAIDRPRYSVVEHGSPGSVRRRPIVPVAASLLQAWSLLKLGSFARAIGHVAALGPDRHADEPVDDAMIGSASAFDRMRRLLPTGRICLLDSIALAVFLHRRRRYPRLVIGVTLAPFVAHCWLQVGDWVLNESVDHAASFTPILVV